MNNNSRLNFSNFLLDPRFSNSLIGINAALHIQPNANAKNDEASNLLPQNSFLGVSRLGSLPYIGGVGGGLTAN